MQLEFNYVPNILVVLCTIIGMLRWRVLNVAERLVILVVALNATADLLAILIDDDDNTYNHFIYSVATLIESLVSFAIYGMVIKKKAFRWAISAAGLSLFLFALINLTAIQGFSIINTYTFIPGSILLVIASYYMLRLTVIDGDLDSNNLVLWFALGTLIYYTTVIPVVGLVPWLDELNPQLNDALFTNINAGAYLLFLLLIIGGLIWKTKKSIFSL